MNVSCPECHSVFRVDPARVPGPGIRARCSVCGGIIPCSATRSWTDDYETQHDAADLLTSQRTARRPAEMGAAAMAEQGARGASIASGGAGAALPDIPRPVTPTRVPPFAPGRRPTPAAAPSVSPPLSGSPIPASASPSAQVLGPSAPRSTAPPNSPPPAAPIAQSPPAPRTPDIPIGAPLSRPQAAPPSAPPPAASPGAGAPSFRDTASVSKQSASAGDQPPTSRPAAHTPSPGKAPINPFLANDPNQKAKRLARALVSDMVAYHPQKRDEGMRAGTLKQLFREEIKKSYEEYVDQIGKEFAESTSHFQDALNDVLAGGKKVF